MCGKRRSGAFCGSCYAKSFTDAIDLFAQPVYQFTFRDSYVVSTCLGSICTIAMGIFIVFIVLTKVGIYSDSDPNRFIVTEGLEYGFFAEETEFDSHLLAIGLQYKAEYQSFISE